MAIQYVGSTTGIAPNGGSVTVGLTNLTGGIASSPSPGDLVIIAIANGGITQVQGGVNSPAGYIEIAELYANGTYDTNLSVSYKFMGASPDTTISSLPSLIATNSATVVVMVFRGVSSTPFDVPAVTSILTTSILADPPAVTPQAEGAWVVAIGAGSSLLTAVYASAGLTGFRSVTAADSYDSVIGMGYIPNASGVVDPAAFTGGGTNASSHTSVAVTLALSPALSGLVSGTFLPTGSSVGTVADSGGLVSAVSEGFLNLLGSAQGSNPVTGSLQNQISLIGASTGRASTFGQIDGQLSIENLTTGRTIVNAVAESPGVPISGSAAAVNSIRAETDGLIELAGSSTAKQASNSLAEGVLNLEGSAAAVNSIRAETDGLIELAGSSTGKNLSEGDLSASIPLTGSTSGRVSVTGQTSGSVELTGSSGAGLVRTGGVAGTISLGGSAAAVIRATANASSTIELTGSTAGNVVAASSSSGVLPLSGDAAGYSKVDADAETSLPFTGASTARVSVTANSSGLIELSGSIRGRLLVVDPNIRRASGEDSRTSASFSIKTNLVVAKGKRNSITLVQK